MYTYTGPAAVGTVFEGSHRHTRSVDSYTSIVE